MTTPTSRCIRFLVSSKPTPAAAIGPFQRQRALSFEVTFCCFAFYYSLIREFPAFSVNMGSRGQSTERETSFSGYGDRVGSGVALAPTMWKGGEIVTDPSLVTKSLKPRTMFYSVYSINFRVIPHTF